MLRRIWQTAGRRRKLIVGSGILLILASIFSIMPFYYIYLLISELLKTVPDPAIMIRMLLFTLVSYFLAYAFLFLGYHVSHEAAYNILCDLRVEMAEKLLKLPLGFFNRTTTGAVAATMNENVEKLELFLAHHFPEMMPVVFVPICLSILLFGIDWRMALAAIGPVAAALIIVLLSRYGWRRRVVEYLKAQDRMKSAIIEYIQGIKVIKIFNLDDESRIQFRDNMAGWARSNVSWNEKIAPPMTIYQAIVTSTLIFIVPVGFWLQSRGSLGKSELLLFLIMGTLFGKVFLRIYSVLRFSREEAECMQRINSIRDAEALAVPAVTIMPRNNSVTFSNVRFGYGDYQVLKGMSFHVDEGEKLAIVGPSGAGKSTIARLIPRLWDVDSGKVLIGGANVKSISTETLMSRVSFVFQDVYLFNDSIYENIRMGRPGADREEIFAAAKSACCHDFIELLPQGYETIVGERGTRISGGEKQRISIARAILKGSPILILDEATVFVDPENELLMQSAISRLAANKTVIVIAHRLSTVTEADRLLVIEEGEIVEQGDFRALIDKKGRFCRMWQSYQENLLWKIRA
jgi:ATP-binding cassette, subfamily B, bacterial IrtA/YbtP